MSFIRNFLKIILTTSILLCGGVLYAANLTLSPVSGVYISGQTVTVTVYVSDNTQSINAVSGELMFPSNLLTVTSIKKDGSIISMWAEDPSYSNTSGKVNFEGVILGGYSGAKGKVITVNFTAKQTGQATLLFSRGSILANDGNATNVINTLGGSTLTIVAGDQHATETTTSPSSITVTPEAPKVVSSTHPEANTWYPNRIAKLSWVVPEDVIAIRTLINKSSVAIPTVVNGSSVKEKTIDLGDDGVYYFHIQFKNNLGWGAITHMPLKTDMKAPSRLDIQMTSVTESVNSHPTFTFTANDEASGVAYFAIKTDNNEVEKIDATGEKTPYTSPRLSPGDHTIIVRAVDHAGNSTTNSLDFKTLALTLPSITSYPQKITVGDPIVITGTTYPDSTVEIVVTSTRGEEIRKTGTSDASGSFTITIDDHVLPSHYLMKARVIDRNDALSGYTEAKAIIVQDSKLFTIGSFVINWISLVVVLLAVVLALGVLLWYTALRFASFRRRTKHLLTLKETLLHQDIALLIDDISKNHNILLKISKKRDLTKEEAKMLLQFKKHLRLTELEIDKHST